MQDLQEALTLSLEQQFQMQLYRDAVTTLSKAALQDMLLETSRQLLIKDNLIKLFMSKS